MKKEGRQERREVRKEGRMGGSGELKEGREEGRGCARKEGWMDEWIE